MERKEIEERLNKQRRPEGANSREGSLWGCIMFHLIAY